MTLEEIERLAAQLGSPEQLKLAARICEKLSATAIGTGDSETARLQRLAQVDAWLAECDAVAQSIERTFDAAEDIRRIREERASHSRTPAASTRASWSSWCSRVKRIVS